MIKIVFIIKMIKTNNLRAKIGLNRWIETAGNVISHQFDVSFWEHNVLRIITVWFFFQFSGRSPSSNTVLKRTANRQEFTVQIVQISTIMQWHSCTFFFQKHQRRMSWQVSLCLILSYPHFHVVLSAHSWMSTSFQLDQSSVLRNETQATIQIK